MMNDIVSIIVPVYKVERYLSDCIESLIGQTYQNIEIILIDDESPDNCGSICDEYAEKDSRIIAIHKKNGGAASARNKGLNIASGELISFVDSDDYVERNAFEYMLSVINRTGADVVQCAFRDIYVNDATDRISIDQETRFLKEDYLCRFLTDWTCGLAWGKLFKRCVLEGVYFETGHVIDDEFFTYKGIMNANTIVYSPTIVYDYRRRASSAMENKNAQERMLLDRLDYLTKRRENIVSRFPELKQDYNYSYLDSLLVYSKDIALTVEVADKIKFLIKQYFRENHLPKVSLGFAWKIKKTCLTSSERLVANKMHTTRRNNNLILFE